MIIEKLFDTFQREAFRIELLSTYHIEREWEVFQKYKKGVPFKYKDNDDFCKEIRTLSKMNKSLIRVHIMPNKLTDYLKFEIKIGYLPQSKAGARIYLLNRSIYKEIMFANNIQNDFWVFDNETVLEFIYDKNGHFISEKIVRNDKVINKCLLLKDKILEVALPLNKWLLKNNKLINSISL